MRKWLHKNWGWFRCFESGWMRATIVSELEDIQEGGGWIVLTSKCDVCGREETASQTRAINDVPKVGDVIFPAYFYR